MGARRVGASRQGRRGDASNFEKAWDRFRRHDFVKSPRARRGRAGCPREAVLRARGDGRRARRGRRPRPPARRLRRCRPRHWFSLFTQRPQRPITRRTMSKLGEKLSVFAVAAIVVLAVVGLAFGAGYLVGKLPL